MAEVRQLCGTDEIILQRSVHKSTQAQTAAAGVPKTQTTTTPPPRRCCVPARPSAPRAWTGHLWLAPIVQVTGLSAAALLKKMLRFLLLLLLLMVTHTRTHALLDLLHEGKHPIIAGLGIGRHAVEEILRHAVLQVNLRAADADMFIRWHVHSADTLSPLACWNADHSVCVWGGGGGRSSR